MNDVELLAFHRAIVAIPSLSREERAVADFVTGFLGERGVAAERFGDNVFAVVGTRGPLLCLNSHLDTVPPSPAWTRPPHTPVVEDGRVYGLGANDAKASVAAMVAAFLRLAARGAELPLRVLLTLATEEETGGKGSEALLPELARRGLRPDAAVVGEPTALEVATSQKGLLVLELLATGEACHAAHGRALGAPNAIRRLARDLLALEGVDLGPPHAELGPVTVEPTVLAGGTARNMVPAEARCILDVRTNPQPTQDETIARLAAVVEGELRTISKRLVPYEVDPAAPIVAAARCARPGVRLFGSRGLSDLVFFAGLPGIKVGPGRTERSHTPDEFVLESEVRDGARFYEDLALAFATLA